MVGDLYRYRRLIWRHAINDLRHRYAGTGLGVVWNVLHPLALIAIYSIVFTSIFQPKLDFSSGGAGSSAAASPSSTALRFAYVLYLCAGFLPWLAFAECLVRGCNAFTDNAIYLKKLPIPEQVFVAQTAASATLGLAISFSLLLGAALVLGLRPTWHWLLLPVPLFALQVLGFGLGLICGTLNVFIRDIGQLLSVALQVVMWTAPVVYTTAGLPAWAMSLLRWHPLVPALDATRRLFLNGSLPEWRTSLGLLAWPAIALLAASMVFRRLRREIRDVV